MRVETRIFLGVALFLFAAAALYAFWTSFDSPTGHVEVAGTTALTLCGGLAFIVGSYFWFITRRITLRPEDQVDAEIAEGAGELGFFSPGSYWPFGLGLAVAVAGVGLAVWQWWLASAGLIAVLFSACGLLFEYYTGTRRAPE